MEQLQLITIWNAEREANRYIKRHNHKYHELVYYISGSGETEIGGVLHSFTPHSFALIPNGVEHNEKHLSGTQLICLGFSGSDDIPFGFYDDPENQIYKILCQTLKETELQKYGYDTMLTLKLNELVLLVRRQKHSAAIPKSFSYIINFIKENYQEPIDLRLCAKQLSLSYDYFQHKFKLLTGYSPQQFLISQRLSAAQNMLAKEKISCTEIAYRCGFSTSSQFSAMFRAKFGITPLQYRKQHK